MTHDEMIAVIKAHKEGKQIECRFISETNNGKWVPVCKNHSWNFDSFEYRIKPEPHYRPFKNAEEVMDAIKEHGMYITTSNHEVYFPVMFQDKLDAVEPDFYDSIDNDWRCATTAFDNFTFTDGTPFGVMED